MLHVKTKGITRIEPTFYGLQVQYKNLSATKAPYVQEFKSQFENL